jgi:hypothetical protein
VSDFHSFFIHFAFNGCLDSAIVCICNVPKGPFLKGLEPRLALLGGGGYFKRWSLKGGRWSLEHFLQDDCRATPSLWSCFEWAGLLPHRFPPWCAAPGPKPRSNRANQPWTRTSNTMIQNNPLLLVSRLPQVFVTVPASYRSCIFQLGLLWTVLLWTCGQVSWWTHAYISVGCILGSKLLGDGVCCYMLVKVEDKNHPNGGNTWKLYGRQSLALLMYDILSQMVLTRPSSGPLSSSQKPCSHLKVLSEKYLTNGSM